MKTTLYYFISVSIFIGLLASSCGFGKKLTSSESKIEKLKKDSIIMSAKLNDCSDRVHYLEQEKTALLDENFSVHDYQKAQSAESQKTIHDKSGQFKNLEKVIQAQKNTMINLKKLITDTLKHYNPDELCVYMKDGNVYVSLEEKLLFESGSTTIAPKGMKALQSLATVLNNTKNISVVIEGHTDSVPVKTTQYKDNWDLSTARATSIVRVLTNDYGVDPKCITASGKGKFHPVNTNETEAGRTGNRRTEVIISPDFEKILGILYTALD